MKPDEIRALCQEAAEYFVAVRRAAFMFGLDKADKLLQECERLSQENEKLRQQLIDVTHGWIEIINTKADIKTSEDNKSCLLDLMEKTRLIYNEVRKI